MVVYKYLLLIALVSVFLTCGPEKKQPKATDDLSQKTKSQQDTSYFTLQEGKLTVLFDNSLSSYFIFRGHPLGYEYEMLQLFASENDLDLNIRVIHQVDQILDSLLAGKGDLVAANLSISQERLQKVNFSKPLFRTRQILVQRLPEDRSKLNQDQIEQSLIRDRLDLAGKSVMVRKNSSYELVLKNLIAETGLELEISYAPGDYATEQLIDMVSNGEIDFTICDENKALLFSVNYDNIDIKTPMSLSQPIAWATNKNASKLTTSINDWIERRKGTLEFNLIANRYFELTRRNQRIVGREYENIKSGKISKYDDLVKIYAPNIGWDWRLLTSQIYKESKFDPTTRSWRGALGLMQVMPRTGRSYGFEPNELIVPEKNIQAGIKHLAMLEEQWKAIISDSVELIKFTLGSYNVGKGHVDDAIRLAEKYNLATDVWDDNVAQMLLKKSIPKYYKDPVVKYGYCRGREPVNYVTKIFQDYELYKEFAN